MADSKQLHQQQYEAVILDIEGTTTSISFVTETLFPYVRRELRNYLDNEWKSPSLQSDIQLLKNLATEDIKKGVEGVPDIVDSEDIELIKQSVIKNVVWQMDQDRKSTALKSLQGHMWSKGYESKELVGHIFEDVPVALKHWNDRGIKVYIYSSGSVEAQKLIFGFSNKGNLLPFIKGHFDTNVGPKIDSKSYTKIAQSILGEKFPSSGSERLPLLFVTDVFLEAQAAFEAGYNVCISLRPGNKPQPEHKFPTIHSFKELI
eukprot:TRINITY_DN4211_c0_g1_i2.p1 TRINITY_DN4211_c0_g1~~TRINITY_DN4211_c0_g1_i2.p1  ORF type:complete len:261 (-),score=53.47 TRINITY_DN4211_c0_g1_i2:217-999(-)